MPAPYLDLPASAAEFEALYSGKFWKEIRRRYRMLERDKRCIEFLAITDSVGMRVWLPRARQVFLKRWEKHYTSCMWADEAGFAVHLDSAATLADQGAAELVVVLVDGVLVTYALNLLHEGTYYIFHHAMLMNESYKPYGLGRLLFEHIIRRALAQGRQRVDFMQGEGGHKSLWARQERQVLWRVTSPRTVSGYLMHGPWVVYYWLRTRLQNQLALKLKLQHSIAWLRDVMVFERVSG